MSPRFKDFLFSFFVAIVVMACVVVTWAYTYDTVLELKNAEFSVRIAFFALLVIAYLAVAMLVLGLPSVKNFQQDITGYVRPITPMPEGHIEKAKNKLEWTIFAFIAILAQPLYFWSVSAYAGSTQQLLLGWLLLSCITLVVAAVFSFPPSFAERYVFATFGLLVPFLWVLNVSAQTYYNTPLIIFLAWFFAPPLIGYVIQQWWNKQDFVIERKRQQAAEQAQLEAARQRELQQQAETQQRAQAEAALKAKLDAIQPVSTSPSAPSSPLSPAAEKIAAEIARRRKQ